MSEKDFGFGGREPFAPGPNPVDHELPFVEIRAGAGVC